MSRKLLNENTVELQPEGPFVFKCSVCKKENPQEVFALCGHTCCEECQEEECSCEKYEAAEDKSQRTKLFVDWQKFAVEKHGKSIYSCDVCTQWRDSNQVVMYQCGHMTCVGCAMQSKKCSICRQEQTTESVKLLHFIE